jgi:hypothetical protein
MECALQTINTMQTLGYEAALSKFQLLQEG